jgi:hypothetical protein
LGFSVSPHVYATDGLDAGYISSQIPATQLVAKGVLRNRSDGVLITDKNSIGGVQQNVPNTPGGIDSATKRSSRSDSGHLRPTNSTASSSSRS